MASETPSGANGDALAPPAGEGTPTKAARGGAPNSPPQQEPADDRAEFLGKAERSAAGADKKGPPAHLEAHVAAPDGESPTITPPSIPEAPSPMATSFGKPAAMDAKEQAGSDAPSDRQDAAAQPITQYSSMPSTSPDLPAEPSKAVPLPTQEVVPLSGDASSADPELLPSPLARQDEQSGQSPAASSGSAASEPQRLQSTAPDSTVYTQPSVPRRPWWPRAALPNMYPYGPYAYPPVFGRQSFGSHSPMYPPFSAGLPYYAWPGR